MLKLIAAIAFICISCSSLSAQIEMYRFYPSVLKSDFINGELNLAGDQISGMSRIALDCDAAINQYVIAGIAAHKHPERQDQLKSAKEDFLVAMESVEGSVKEVLIPSQQLRFKQLVLRYQVYSTEGVNNSPVLSPTVGLDLSVSQEKKIEAILEERRKARQEIVDKMNEDLLACDKAFDQKIRESLSQEQEVVLNEKIGPTVDFSKSSMRMPVKATEAKK